ncbi:MAG: hypothetical protein WC956_02640 [bacterium]
MSIPGVIPLNSVTLTLTPPTEPPTDLSVSVALIDEPTNTQADAVVSFSAAATEQGGGLVERVGPQEYMAFYATIPGEERLSFGETTRKGVVAALTRTQMDGKKTAVIDYSGIDFGAFHPVEDNVVLAAILGGVRTYAQLVHDGERPVGLTDVVVAMGKSAYFVLQHQLGGDLEKLILIKQPIVVDFTKGQKIPAFDVNDPPDVTLTFEREPIRGRGIESVHLVNTNSFFRRLVRWKMAFAVYRQWDRYFLWLARWQNCERASPHDILDEGRESFIRHFGETTRGGLFEKGYVRAEGKGRFKLDELGGSPYLPVSASNEFRSSRQTSLNGKGSQLMSIFTGLGIMADFGNTGHSIHPDKPMFGYGPR